MAQILETDIDSLRKAAQALKEGQLVAFPTETVYGLGGNALSAPTVARIFEVKKRPSFDPLIVHVANKEDVFVYCKEVPEKAIRLIEKFWPGPLTLILPRKEIIPDIVSAGLSTVAIRMPSHPVARALIKEANIPVAAPSANLFSKLSPTRAEHVIKQIGDKIEYIIDGGPTQIGVESTVLYIDEREATLLRPGGLPVEEIEEEIGTVKILEKNEKIQSPGQLHVHYSPHTPLYIIDRNQPPKYSNKKIGYLAFEKWPAIEVDEVQILSPSGDLIEAAARLFSCLHNLDEAGVDIILAERIPEVGLGRAIMDRLKKAMKK